MFSFFFLSQRNLTQNMYSRLPRFHGCRIRNRPLRFRNTAISVYCLVLAFDYTSFFFLFFETHFISIVIFIFNMSLLCRVIPKIKGDS